MINYKKTLEFYKGKTVLVTGSTGFKGSWLCKILLMAGANVIGYALKPENGSLFYLLELENSINQFYSDIRNFEALNCVVSSTKPDIIFHLAAQPIVLKSYDEPKCTYETNINGTLNVLECTRLNDCVKSLVNVTTDKVYLNTDSNKDFTESDKLCGFDPYSNSKSCSELITYSYANALIKRPIWIATARAGNVIGGGDFSENRIIPDCVRFLNNNKECLIRNPNSTRPYQHVLDALFAYLEIGHYHYNQAGFDSFNIGPDVSTKTLDVVSNVCARWGKNGNWIISQTNQTQKESKLLMLNTEHIKKELGWEQKLDIYKAIEWSIDWYIAWSHLQILECNSIIENQIKEFLEL